MMGSASRLLFAITCGCAAIAAADSTGPLSPSTVTVTNVGDFSWTNLTPESQGSIDGNYASIVLPGSGATSDETFASGFGASVPPGATITGIEITFEVAFTGLGGPDDEATITMGSIATPGTPVIADLPDTGADEVPIRRMYEIEDRSPDECLRTLGAE